MNIILAGVGGQGILSLARAISLAAVGKGLHVKQAEVHGMSQRGGAVYSHLRLSADEIFSDLIPVGEADMVISVEPMEALRYSSLLREDGIIVASSNAMVNITNYPQIEPVLEHIGAFRRHITLDMERLGRAAGSPLAANIVALGAASLYMPFSASDLESAIMHIFEAKGERIVNANVRAFRFGRAAGTAYLDGLQRGIPAAEVRSWIETLEPEAFEDDVLEFPGEDVRGDISRLSAAEAHAAESLLMNAWEEGRSQLYEHEIYSLLELVGAISPPKFQFIPKGSSIERDALDQFAGDQVVLKVVSPEVVHKSDVGGVSFVPKRLDAVDTEIRRMISHHSEAAHVAGVLVVEYIEHDAKGLGKELFVGIRATREFGPVIAAGLGGLDTEYLAQKMRPGVAVAKAVAMDITAEEFLELFRKTAAYEAVSGQIRGHERVVSDAELLRCFRAFISLARRFCIDRGDAGPDVGELEVNPFAFLGQRLVPLDGRGRLQTAASAPPARPLEHVKGMLIPERIAVIGVSSKEESFGRIILRNILKSGFDPGAVTVIKEGASSLDGVSCVSTVFELEQTVDLLVVTAPAEAVPQIMQDAATSGRVRAGILISGGAGESEESSELGPAILKAIREGRGVGTADGPVWLGPNCMGAQSWPGRYDTFFVPEDKLEPTTQGERQPLAILSQSGAFIVSRLSEMPHLRPQYTISLGNQSDVALSDLLWALKDRDEVQVLGIYLEGFANWDGLETLRAVQAFTKASKTVIAYKAGRTEQGRQAAAGHTAAVAGDYDICLSALQQVGAMVATSFREFGMLLETSTLLQGKSVGEGRVFAVTNAGMESVGMADNIASLAGLSLISEPLHNQIEAICESHRLRGLVTIQNPLDLTAMADEAAYEAIVKAALDSEQVDAVIVSCVPLAPQLRTLQEQLGDPASFVQRVPVWLADTDKAVAFVIDGGKRYDPLVEAIREQGVPVFGSADEAAKTISVWLAHRKLCLRPKQEVS